MLSLTEKNNKQMWAERLLTSVFELFMPHQQCVISLDFCVTLSLLQ